MIPRAQHVAMTRFLLLSCGLHLLLLVGHGRTTETANLRYLGLPEITVAIEGATRAAPGPHKAPVIPSFSGKHASSVAAATSSVDESGPAATPTATPANDTTSWPEQSFVAPADSGLRNQLLGELQTSLARYLTYPPLARERGWQGTVLLGLHVESDGHLKNIRLEHSSGYAVLDRSALNSLSRLGYLTEAVAWLNGRSVDVQLPVIYRLVEN